VVRTVVDTEYAACACSPTGKLKRVSRPYAPGDPVYWTTYTYDGLGRTLSVVAPDGASTTAYAYQGNRTTVTDPAGKWKTFTNDAFGNLVQVTEPNPAGGNLETYYTYDGLNNLTQVSMPRGGYTQTRTFVYNGRRLTSATNPENGTVNYTYNTDWTVATRTDARGVEVAYDYETYGRLYRVRLRDPYGYTTQVQYYYDSNPFDPYVSEYAWGRLAAVQEQNGHIYMYGYTQGGLMKTKRLRVVDTNYTDLDTVYAYDNEGRETSVRYPSGNSILRVTTASAGPIL
jgi:YD repeat-containing protein